MLDILAERDFPVDEIRLFASARSAGKTIEWNGTQVTIEDASTADYTGLDIALFSAGKTTSLAKLAARLVGSGKKVLLVTLDVFRTGGCRHCQHGRSNCEFLVHIHPPQYLTM